MKCLDWNNFLMSVFPYQAFITLWDTHEHENVFSEQTKLGHFL
jgi:hypothetical protein